MEAAAGEASRKMSAIVKEMLPVANQVAILQVIAADAVVRVIAIDEQKTKS